MCAEIVATCAFSLRVLTGRDIVRKASMAAFAATSMPRLRSIALAPATTLRRPSAKIACARTVDVLVPSPTLSPVFSAACRSICAPRFSSGSLRSNSLAIVMPSLQTIGVPQFFWMSTDFDFGPNVTRTASHSSVAPRRIFSRAAERKRTCLWAIERPRFSCGLRSWLRFRQRGISTQEALSTGRSVRPTSEYRDSARRKHPSQGRAHVVDLNQGRWQHSGIAAKIAPPEER